MKIVDAHAVAFHEVHRAYGWGLVLFKVSMKQPVLQKRLCVMPASGLSHRVNVNIAMPSITLQQTAGLKETGRDKQNTISVREPAQKRTEGHAPADHAGAEASIESLACLPQLLDRAAMQGVSRPCMISHSTLCMRNEELLPLHMCTSTIGETVPLHWEMLFLGRSGGSGQVMQ